MALISCPECGKEKVSDTAPTCPECGYAIREHFEKIEQTKLAKEQQIQHQRQAEEKSKREAESKKVKEQRRLENITMPEKPKLTTSRLFGVIGLWLVVILLSLTPPANGDPTSPESFMLKFCLMVILPIMNTVMFFKWRNKLISDYELAIKNFKEYQNHVIREQDEADAQAERDYQRQVEAAKNAPKCPSCKSSNVKPISTTSRVVSVSMVGLASSKIGKTMECKNCGYKW